MTKIHMTHKFFFTFVFSVFLLSACNKDLETPEAVLQKAKEAVVDVDSGRIEASVDLKGEDSRDKLSLKGDIAVAFDGRQGSERKTELDFALSGVMEAEDKLMNGDLDFQMVTTGNQYYFKLNKLSSNDEGFSQLEPFLNLYKEKWLRISEDFIPESFRNLQNEEADELKIKQQADLFLDTKFFTVDKEYGVEKVNGQKVYHYGLNPNRDEFKAYMSKSALLDGQELTDAELEQMVAFLDNLEQVEFFVDTDDYSVRRAIFGLKGDAQSPDFSMVVDIALATSDFNQSVDIKTPESAEDFNPLNLLMGIGSLPVGEGSLPASDLNLDDSALEGDNVPATN